MFKKNLTRRLCKTCAVLALCLVSLLCLPACRTAPPLPPVNLSEPGWTIRQGQALWCLRKDATELSGEVLVASHPDGRSVVLFTKTPLPFVVGQLATNSWQIEFVPVHKVYSGHGLPSKRLLWLQLPGCLAGSPPPKPWVWQRTTNNGWRLENPNTGEWLEGYLNP